MNPKPTILIADDEPSIRTLLKKFYEGHGHRVLTASDGRQAVEMAAGDKVDVAVLDVRMPRMNGVETLRKIKQMDPGIEVLLITGHADLEDFRQVIFEEGACDFIQKPFKMRNLLERTEKALGRRMGSTFGSKPDSPFQGELSLVPTPQPTRSQLNYCQLVENSNDMIVVLQGGRFQFANPRLTQITGYASKEILRMKLQEIVHPEAHALFRFLGAGEEEQPAPTMQTFEILKRDGGSVWVEANFVETAWDGAPAHMGILRDISKRKETEETLRKARDEMEQRVSERTAELLQANDVLQSEIEERKRADTQIEKSKAVMQAILDGISEPLMMLEGDLTIRALNRAAVDYFQVEFREAVGTRCYKLVGQTEPCKGCRVVDAFNMSQPLVLERDGRMDIERLEKLFIYPIVEDKGHSTAVIVRISDVTEERERERQLMQNEKLASLGLLISGIAHEINNPNNFLTLNIPVLKDYLNEVEPILMAHADSHPDLTIYGMQFSEWWQDLKTLLENMEHGVERINLTVGNLRQFSRLNGDDNREWVDVTRAVENSVGISGAQMKRMVKSFEIEVAEDLPPVYASQDALERILINLLINAAQAADKPDSWIRLNVRLGDNDQVIVEVADNGCGMSEKVRSRIFEPFFTTKHRHGTGLGLYVTQNLVEGLGGTIQVESTAEGGSIFRVVLKGGPIPAAALEKIQAGRNVGCL
jgi:PAS domain S-box-containing protein